MAEAVREGSPGSSDSPSESADELDAAARDSSGTLAGSAETDVRDLFPASRVSPLSWGLEAVDWQTIQRVCETAAQTTAAQKAKSARGRAQAQMGSVEPDGSVGQVGAAGSFGPLATLLEEWLTDVEQATELRPTDGLELIAWAHRWRDLTEVVSQETCDRLQRQFALAWDQTVDHGNVEASSMTPSDDDLTDVDPLDHAWRQVELPLTLAVTFPKDERRAAWAERAADQLNRAWAQWVDPEGLPRASLLKQLPEIFASWTRSRHLWRATGLPGWTDNHTARFDALIAAVLRLRRSDGTCAGSQVPQADEAGATSGAATLDAALSAALVGEGRGELIPLAKAVGFPVRSVKRPAARHSAVHAERETSPGDELPPPADDAAESASGPSAATPTDYSEFAQLASCRSHLAANGLHVVAAFPGDTSLLEISLFKQSFLAGPWRLRVQSDGCEHAVAGQWHEVSWFSDEDADYLELGIDLEHGWYVRRHMLLARDARLLFVGDAVFGPGPGQIIYEAEIPLAPNVQFAPAEETHDGKLIGAKGRATVLPLALPEWRTPGVPANATLDLSADWTSGVNGQLSSDGSSLQWSQRRTGQRLFAPLVISCDPRTVDSPLTWRHLTVAESRQIVSADVAVAFRVQIARKQWFFYRSLGGFGNRTALGQNVSGQFVSGEFLMSGLLRGFVETEMEVET